MKPHPDSLQRFLFEQSHVRGELVHLDAAWRAVLVRHASVGVTGVVITGFVRAVA
jgi:redox-regulated HSP33 family molecular chaperone